MSQLLVVCFDVRDPKRLRSVAKEILNFGKRVQYSVFECHLDAKQLQQLKERLHELIDTDEDALSFFPLCPKDEKNILVDGDIYKSQDVDFYMI